MGIKTPEQTQTRKGEKGEGESLPENILSLFLTTRYSVGDASGSDGGIMPFSDWVQ